MSTRPEVPPPFREFDEWLSLPRAPYTGFTAGDLDRIEDLPAHTELIDGVLVPRSPQNLFHMRMNGRLEDGLDRQVPVDVLVLREFTVVLGERQRLEPDLVLAAPGSVGMDDTWVAPDAVLLVAEVASPDSEVRDRDRKPQLYARAGIPHFWLVEMDGAGGAVAYTYELDPVNQAYTGTGVHRERLQVGAPCQLDIDLTRSSPGNRAG